MTFDEWRKSITHDLRKAGFTVEERSGFPFVPSGSIPSLEAKLAILEFKSTLPQCVHFYKEGALFTPEWPERLNVA